MSSIKLLATVTCSDCDTSSQQEVEFSISYGKEEYNDVFRVSGTLSAECASCKRPIAQEVDNFW